MKRRNNHLLYILLFIGLMGTLNTGAQGVLTVDLQSLKEVNDSLLVEYRAWVPQKSVAKGEGLRIVPLLQAGDSLLFLPRMTILGKNKHKVLARYHNNSKLGYPPHSMEGNENTPFNYRVQVPYEFWMDSARLVIRQEVSGYRGHKVITRYLLPGGVELAPRLPYQVKAHVALMTPPKEEKRRKRQGKAYLDFQVGRSVILPDFRRNPEELQKINEAIQEVVSNPDAQLQGLYVEGYASPEGSYTLNERLSRERATALKEYIRTRFSFPEQAFQVSFTPEDWSGLEALVEASQLTGKESVLEVIRSNQAPDQKEVALKRVNGGVPYRSMLKELFPELRRVEYQIDYSVRDYGVEETKILLKQKPEHLSQLEFYELALHFGPESKAYGEILMETVLTYFKDDPVANNNAAALMLQRGETATAARYLEKAGESAETANNRGVLLLLKGELEKAEPLFQRAAQAGLKEAEENLTELAAKRKDNEKMERYKKRTGP